MQPVEDVNVSEMNPLVSPRTLKNDCPAPDAALGTVGRTRDAIRRILRKEDPRLLVVVGPCSIHDAAAAREYAERLNAARRRYEDRLLIVMRTYFEKPRTTIGWRGLINDPHMDGSFDMIAGLQTARRLLIEINGLGLPVGVEMLDPVTPQYFADLVSWASIGARTTESQTHRALASGSSMPVGFKNGTDGGFQVAIDAMVSAGNPHSFLGIDQDGLCCVVKTKGNPDGMLILRGGRSGPNYDHESAARAIRQLEAAGLKPSLMVDCSHANSGYDPHRQAEGWRETVRQRIQGNRAIIGLMAESHLFAGKQSIPDDLSTLRYGVSVTDACLDWEATDALLADAHAALRDGDRAVARELALSR